MIHLALFSMLELAPCSAFRFLNFRKESRIEQGLKELIGIIEIVKDPEKVTDRHQFYSGMQNETVFERERC